MYSSLEKNISDSKLKGLECSMSSIKINMRKYNFIGLMEWEGSCKTQSERKKIPRIIPFMYYLHWLTCLIFWSIKIQEKSTPVWMSQKMPWLKKWCTKNVMMLKKNKKTHELCSAHDKKFHVGQEDPFVHWQATKQLITQCITHAEVNYKTS